MYKINYYQIYHYATGESFIVKAFHKPTKNQIKKFLEQKLKCSYAENDYYQITRIKIDSIYD